jgi:PEP-CTERM putative exosortase interaction domain
MLRKIESLMFRIVLTVTGMAACAAPGYASTVISAGTMTVNTGQTFNLNVSISGITDLFSWQFDLSFDHTLLTANSITEGPFLKSLGGTTNYVAGTINNTTGKISNTADTLTGAAGTGVSGSGVLAIVSFTAGATTGISTIALSNIFLSDSNFNPIVNTPQNGSVTIAGAPEPNTLALLGAALLLGLLYKIRS